jgi:hypothetical protein
VQLHDAVGQRGAHGRDGRLLIGTSGKDDVRRLDDAVVAADEIPRRARLLTNGADRDAAPDRCRDQRGVALEELYDLIARRETVGIVARITVAGWFERPVGELEGQRVPPLTPPPLDQATALEKDVLETALTEMVAEGQTGLAAADDDGLDLLGHATGKPAQYSVFRVVLPGPTRAAAAMDPIGIDVRPPGPFRPRAVPARRSGRRIDPRQQPRQRRSQAIPEVRPRRHGIELTSHSVSRRADLTHRPTASGAREARIGLMRENCAAKGDWVLDSQISRSGVRRVPLPPHECLELSSSRARGALATHSARATR